MVSLWLKSCPAFSRELCPPSALVPRGPSPWGWEHWRRQSWLSPCECMLQLFRVVLCPVRVCHICLPAQEVRLDVSTVSGQFFCDG